MSGLDAVFIYNIGAAFVFDSYMAFSSVKVGHLVVFMTCNFFLYFSRMTTDFSVMSVYIYTACLVCYFIGFSLLIIYIFHCKNKIGKLHLV